MLRVSAAVVFLALLVAPQSQASVRPIEFDSIPVEGLQKLKREPRFIVPPEAPRRIELKDLLGPKKPELQPPSQEDRRKNLERNRQIRIRSLFWRVS
ncbi:MAG: hypothetical protein ACYTGL_08625 [Planctomycetota bacterium]|jgi:hypothetical protein